MGFFLHHRWQKRQKQVQEEIADVDDIKGGREESVA